jgi:hypothetical protein
VIRDAAQYERTITQNGTVQENLILMRDELGRHFPMSELHNLSLLDTCKLFIALKEQEESEKK